MKPFQLYTDQRSRQVVGLMSGTSADGIDAIAVRFPARHEQDDQKLEILDFQATAYPAQVRARVMEAAANRLSLRDTAVLSTELGHLFAEAALAVMPKSGCDLVASHGQTVCHLPEHATTLQIGEAAVIACRTGVVTISDFRTADMACGGQGAPLVPLFDAYILAHPCRLRVAVNLGGIANITVIGPQPETAANLDPLASRSIRAWDTGPANCLSDALCRMAGLGDFDADGHWARQGHVRNDLLQELLVHPYFSRDTPKSTGLEDFGEDFARPLIGRAETCDLLRTVLALSAQSLCDDLVETIEREAQASKFEGVDLVFAGGGTSNSVLMDEIRTRFGIDFRANPAIPVNFASFADFGVPEAGREAAAFAFLGDRTARGLAGAVVGATGAHQPALLGKISHPPLPKQISES